MSDLIRAREGVLSRVAGDLGVSRPTLYKWIWQLGLSVACGLSSEVGPERLVNVDGGNVAPVKPVNSRESGNNGVKCVKPGGASRPILSGMASPALLRTAPPAEPRIQRSVLLTESRWSWARKHAIDAKVSASDVVEAALDLYRQALLEDAARGEAPPCAEDDTQDQG